MELATWSIVIVASLEELPALVSTQAMWRNPANGRSPWRRGEPLGADTTGCTMSVSASRRMSLMACSLRLITPATQRSGQRLRGQVLICPIANESVTSCIIVASDGPVRSQGHGSLFGWRVKRGAIAAEICFRSVTTHINIDVT
jgi:hypothetical protein